MKPYHPPLVSVFLFLLIVGFGHAATTKCYVFAGGNVCLNTTSISSPLGTLNFTGGGGSGTADGNNYTTGINFVGGLLTLTRSGMTSLTATYTNLFDTERSIIIGNITSLNATKAGIGNCPAGQLVMNTTTSGVQCVTPPAVGGLSIIEIMANIGNWSGNASSYSTVSFMQGWVNGNGNWSLERTGVMKNITDLQGVYNYSLDRGNIYTNITNLQSFRTGIYVNVTNLQAVYNYSLDRAGLYTNITSAQGSISNLLANYNYTLDRAGLYINVTNLQAVYNYTLDRTNIYTNITNLQSFRTGVYTNVTNLQAVYNYTLDRAGLYTNITNQQANYNYSLDRIALIGNISALNLSKGQIGNCPTGQFIQNITGTTPQCYTPPAVGGLSITEVMANLGNWSGNYTVVLGNISSLNATKGGTGNCAAGQLVMNVTNSGVQCYTDQTGGGGLSGGTTGLPAVWTGVNTLGAFLINSTMLNATNTGVVGQYPQFNSSGQISWVTVAGTGTVTGTGVSAFLALWSSTIGITNSSVWENNSQVNITKDLYLGNGTGTAYITGNNGNNDLTISATNTNISGRINAGNGMYDYTWLEGLHSQAFVCDFLPASAVTMCYPNYLGAALTGTAPTVAPFTKNTFGVVNITSTAAADTGYYFMTNVNAFLIGGGEDFKAQIFISGMPASNTSRIRIGFGDSITVAAQIVDGMYFDINSTSTANTAQPVVVSNSVGVFASHNYNFTSNQWYTVRVLVNATATGSEFYIYDSTGAQVYNEHVTATHPTAVGRTTGAGIIASAISLGLARSIVAVDYLSTQIDQTRRYG